LIRLCACCQFKMCLLCTERLHLSGAWE
jgi:hypothetical protein